MKTKKIICGCTEMTFPKCRHNPKPESQQQQHTPTPWRVTHQIHTDGTNDIVVDGRVIAHLGGSLKGDDQYSIDAKFIVEAVNSYEKLKRDNEELIRAVRLARKRIKHYQEDQVMQKNPYDFFSYAADVLDKAIAQAEGESNGK